VGFAHLRRHDGLRRPTMRTRRSLPAPMGVANRGGRGESPYGGHGVARSNALAIGVQLAHRDTRKRCVCAAQVTSRWASIPMNRSAGSPADTTTTNIPARLDRLPWSRWHLLVVLALGVTWLLDGLEGNLAGSLAGILKGREGLSLTDADLGLAGSIYLMGSVLGALVFGYATDRLGRKRLFSLTLVVYLSATAATAFSWNFASFAFFRAITGAGIGGEYAAINSAIDELIPARVRGRVDLIVNATFWIGAAIGAGASLVLLNTSLIPPAFAWRFAFGIGAIIGLGVLALRQHLPESPRWLMVHGRVREAEATVDAIERMTVTPPTPLPARTLPLATDTIVITKHEHTPWRDIWHAMIHEYRRRSILGFTLMVTQAFFYNAVLFTYGLVLLRYYQVPAARLGLYLIPLALGNFLGPLLIGHLFDTIGRKPMIAGTYVLSGVLLAVTSWLFRAGALTVFTQALSWSVIFFVASSAASSAYLTVSEIFPLEIRAFAIALFYTCGTFAGGVGGPALFGYLVGTGSRELLFRGYLAGACAMILGGIAEAFLGVKAEGLSLEAITKPLATRD
jgi:MFS family permease